MLAHLAELPLHSQGLVLTRGCRGKDPAWLCWTLGISQSQTCAPSHRTFKEKYLRDRAGPGAIPESLPKASSLTILSHFDDMMEKEKMGKLIELWKKKWKSLPLFCGVWMHFHTKNG